MSSSEHETELAPVDACTEQMLTTTQVAHQLQLSEAMVRKAIRDGRLEASLPAGSKNGYRIAPSAVDRWLTASLAQPKSRR